MKLLLLSILMLNFGCAVVGRDLPPINIEEVSSKNKIDRILYIDLKSNNHYSPTDKEFQENIKKPLVDSNYFSEVFFEEIENYDLKFKLRHIVSGFYEPYCIFTLMLLPCTPPLEYAIAVKVEDKKGNTLGKYFYKEDAVTMGWTPGLLIPYFHDKRNKPDAVIQNIYHYLLKDLKRDNIL